MSNLDAKLRSELRVEIKRLHQQLENTMIYVTHDQIEALTLADRIAVMRGGYIQQLADPKTIYNKPANLFVAGFIGSPAMTMLKGRIADARRLRPGRRRPCRSTATTAPSRRRAPRRSSASGRSTSRCAPRARGSPPSIDIDEPMGSDSLLWMTIAGQPISARIGADHPFRHGQPVRLDFDITARIALRPEDRTAPLNSWKEALRKPVARRRAGRSRAFAAAPTQ